jgi:hypothetical protein
MLGAQPPGPSVLGSEMGLVSERRDTGPKARVSGRPGEFGGAPGRGTLKAADAEGGNPHYAPPGEVRAGASRAECSRARVRSVYATAATARAPTAATAAPKPQACA